VTHPIQYQAPLLRRIAAEPGIDLTVFFCSDFSLRSYLDPDFGKAIAWDIPLTGGYRHEILPAVGGRDRVSFWRPFNYGLARRLNRGNFDVLWVHGYNRWFHWRAMAGAKIRGLKVLVRDEATPISAPRSYLKRIVKRWFFLGLRKCVDGFLASGPQRVLSLLVLPRGFPVPLRWIMAFLVIRPGGRREREHCARTWVEAGRPASFTPASYRSQTRRDLLEAYIRMSPDQAGSASYLVFIGDGDQQSLERRAGAIGFHQFWDSKIRPNSRDIMTCAMCWCCPRSLSPGGW
jgi:hypothetical protein